MEKSENPSFNPLYEWPLAKMQEVYDLFEKIEGHMPNGSLSVCDVLFPTQAMDYGMYDGLCTPKDMVYLYKRFSLAKKIYRKYGIPYRDVPIPSLPEHILCKAAKETLCGLTDEIEEDPDIVMDFYEACDSVEITDFAMGFTTDFSDIGDFRVACAWQSDIEATIRLACEIAEIMLSGGHYNDVVEETLIAELVQFYSPYDRSHEEQLERILKKVVTLEWDEEVDEFIEESDYDDTTYRIEGFFVFTSKKLAEAYTISNREIRDNRSTAEMELFENVLFMLSSCFIRESCCSGRTRDISSNGEMTFIYTSSFDAEMGTAVGTPPVFLRCGLRFYAMCADALAERIIASEREGGPKWQK